MKRKFTAIVLLTVFLFVLCFAGCSAGKPDLPMEATIDGYTVILGKTTMQDLIDQGYTVGLTVKPDAAKKGDKYIAFSYGISKGVGEQFWVSVYVPWNGKSDISEETKLSATEGIVRTITLKKSSLKKLDTTYNDLDLQEITFEYAKDEWGVKEKEDTAIATYSVEAKKGFVTMRAESIGSDEFYELTLQIYSKEFEKMQK